MTKKEEALQSVLSYCVEECGKIDTCRSETPNCVEAVVIQALEKQIPKKPVYKDELFLGKPWKAPYCPTCGDSWNSDEFGECMKYCWECGQAIDWSENEET